MPSDPTPSSATTDRSGLWVLSPTECRQLLGNHLPRIGRVGLIDGDEPVVLPVTYWLDGEDVIVRTHHASLLHEAAGGEQAVAFEVDEVDAGWREGWSVLIRGRAEAVTDDDEAEFARLQNLPLRSWAPAAKERFLRITPVEISGRRIQ